MNPRTYATLYGPWRPTPPPARTATAVAAGVTWTLTGVSLAWLTVLVVIVALWSLAAGATWTEVGAALAPYAVMVAGGAAVLTALAFAPGIRRLSASTRLLITGLLACPVPTAVAVRTWLHVG